MPAPWMELQLDRPRVARLCFAQGSRVFDGHFPGQPVLPGIALLAAVERAARELDVLGVFEGMDELAVAADLPLLTVRKIKFRRQVQPGDGLEVRFGGRSAGQFVVVGADGPIAEGEIVVDSVGCARRAAADAGLGYSPLELPATGREPAPDAVLPHVGAARLIRNTEAATFSEAVATGEIPAEHAMAEDPWGSRFLAIEFVAQASALLTGRPAGPDGRFRGFLVRVREFACARGPIPVDVPLRVELRITHEAGPLSTHRGRLVAGNELIATATVGVFRELYEPTAEATE